MRESPTTLHVTFGGTFEFALHKTDQSEAAQTKLIRNELSLLKKD